MKRQWGNEDLIEHWMLSIWDLGQLGNKTGATRLGFAVLLKFFQRAGRFPTFKNDIPGVVISFVANQVGVPPEVYLQYDWQGCTIKDHRAEIRRLLDFRESTIADAEQMQQWLITEVLPQEHQDERLREEAYAWFRREHLEAPTPDRLTRLIRSAAHGEKGARTATYSFRELLALHIEQMRAKGAVSLFESVRKHKYTDRGVRKLCGPGGDYAFNVSPQMATLPLHLAEKRGH